MEDHNRIFAARLKVLRLEKKMSYRELAKGIGIGHATLSRYEKLERSATVTNIKKIAAYFKVTTAYLLGESDDYEPKES